MKKIVSLAVVLIAAIALPGLAMAQEEMSGEELKEAFSGNTSIGTASRGGPYWVYRNPNGDQSFVKDSGWSDEGKWWINDKGESCSKWEKIRKGKTLCGKIFRLGNDRYMYIKPDGSEGRFKIVKGNPENL